ncbi:thermonuclease family protein [Nocardioides sp. CPCC 205120]|uniref:thermonuclease family protein n=1 Tax=Nocardioides sp. CPCC 205120 TaxID=3406462 RepID=UPI003B51123F
MVLTAIAVLAVWLAGRSAQDGTGSGGPGGADPGAGTALPATSAVLVAVTDGDTLRVRTDTGAEERVRLVGIDTPEVHNQVECGGPEASALMGELVRPGDALRLVADPTQDDVDRYDRLLRYVETADGTDLGEAVLAAGWAEVYVFDTEPQRFPAYSAAQSAARDGDRGVWGAC